MKAIDSQIPVSNQKQAGQNNRSKQGTASKTGALNGIYARIRMLEQGQSSQNDDIAALKRDVYRIEKRQQREKESQSPDNSKRIPTELLPWAIVQ